MNIIYLTTAQHYKDYDEYILYINEVLNTSNQVFHNKLIKALSLSNNVYVFPYRSIASDNEEINKSFITKDNAIIWDYASVDDKYESYVLNKCKMIENPIVFVDILNYRCLKTALVLRQKLGYKIIGIVTDYVMNISSANILYKLLIKSKSKNLDGYVCLTNNLAIKACTNKKPNLVIEGLVDTIETTPVNEKYIFFSGCLMKKYGIYNLIEAFKRIKDNELKLYVCGHHCNEKLMQAKIKDDDRIVNLGCISNLECIKYQNSSICNINPRPVSHLDKYSVPSKTLEYMAATSPAVSVHNKYLHEIIKDNVIWAKDNTPSSLQDVIELVLKLNASEKLEIIKKQNNFVVEKYSLKSVNNKLMYFLNNLVK